MANRRDILNGTSILNRQQVSLAELTGALVSGDAGVVEAAAPGGALMLADDGSVQLGSFRLTPTGLVVSDGANESEWENVGTLLRRLEGSIQWLIGDWFLFAERNWGKTYEAIAAETEYSEKTLREYAYVARNVHLSIRMDKLKFGHHQLVAGLDEDQQRAWLEWAAENNASISQMRKAMRGGDDEASPTLPQGWKQYKLTFDRLSGALRGELSLSDEQFEQELALFVERAWAARRARGV